ncbi:zinc-ribbon domain-containing protein [Rhodobacter sp. NTK016B]|uniref:zinc-ribbon domain-containing protein n=1 Tax=Rhodobacter sp. NTK016B TaxID=2759676 RepID=UPI001A8C45BD|nr:zinc-ribbon domain-containing protein [Rhodobacter sp. NTK016B]MBN8293160.1 zinc-ribbon domain-containing protein [Rhodobacter sp. NTK016B]
MRLTCPNCNAQYEVDEKVIPKGGRDVQCSACGHTWYQYPMDVALQMRAADLDDDDEDFETEDALDDDDADERGPVPGRPQAAPRIDKTVLDVLREEAEREMGERKRARTGIETQGDLGLTRPQRSKAAPSRVYGEDDPALPDDSDAQAPDESKPEETPVSRRKLLPDIEELTSTLEPGSDRDADGDEDDDDEDGKGFRRGLSLVVLIVIALAVLYLLAPVIANALPFLRGPLVSYVGLVDSLRASMAGGSRSLLGG